MLIYMSDKDYNALNYMRKYNLFINVTYEKKRLLSKSTIALYINSHPRLYPIHCRSVLANYHANVKYLYSIIIIQYR